MSYYEKINERAQTLEAIAREQSVSGCYWLAAETETKAKVLREIMRDMPASVANTEVA